MSRLGFFMSTVRPALAPLGPPVISYFGSLPAGSKYSSFTLAANNCLYAGPIGTTNILKLDPTTDSLSTFGTVAAGSNSYEAGCRAANGKIYYPPYNATSILVVDPATDTVSTFGSFSSGGYKWTVPILAPNGKIYCLPSSATTVLVIDPSTNTSYTIGSLSGSFKFFSGGLGANGLVYGFKNGGVHIQIDPATDTITTNSDAAQVLGAFLDFNDDFCLTSSDNLRLLDPPTFTISPVSFLAGFGSQAQGFVQGPNYKGYTVPRTGTLIEEVDVLNSYARTRYTGIPEGTDKFFFGRMAANGAIYMCPNTYTQVLKISNIGSPVSGMYTFPSLLSDLPTSLWNKFHNNY